MYVKIKTMMRQSNIFPIIFFLLTASCVGNSPTELTTVPDTQPIATIPMNTHTVTQPLPPTGTESPPATATFLPSSTQQPSPSPTSGPLGPESYPPDINPLSGLPVSQPKNLNLPPALISIPNSPVSARPQAGLSFSPLVFEMYIGEGATRFLALFYGDYPYSEDVEAYVGPIRSGRIPYETLRTIYNGFLMFAGASWRVLPFLDEYIVVYNEDPENINGARTSVSRMIEIAQIKQEFLGAPAFSGLLFDKNPPPGGKPGNMLWVAFNYTAQVFWRFDSGSGAYMRYQDQGEGTPLQVLTDKLNEENLTYENVIVLYTDYHRYDELYFDIDLLYVNRYPALLFRDGKMYEIYWTTRNQEPEWTTGKLRPIRFIDYDGNPIALKPGQTWVELIQLHSPTYETIDTTDYRQLSTIWERGSGNWAVIFDKPAFEAGPLMPE
jgi:hypothetical protein